MAGIRSEERSFATLARSEYKAALENDSQNAQARKALAQIDARKERLLEVIRQKRGHDARCDSSKRGDQRPRK